MSKVLHIKDVHDYAVGELGALHIAHACPQLFIYGGIGLLAEQFDYPLVPVQPAQAENIVDQAAPLIEAQPEGLVVQGQGDLLEVFSAVLILDQLYVLSRLRSLAAVADSGYCREVLDLVLDFGIDHPGNLCGQHARGQAEVAALREPD